MCFPSILKEEYYEKEGLLEMGKKRLRCVQKFKKKTQKPKNATHKEHAVQGDRLSSDYLTAGKSTQERS